MHNERCGDGNGEGAAYNMSKVSQVKRTYRGWGAARQSHKDKPR